MSKRLNSSSKKYNASVALMQAEAAQANAAL